MSKKYVNYRYQRMDFGQVRACSVNFYAIEYVKYKRNY